MSIRLGNVTILVRDYDEALKFYTEVKDPYGNSFALVQLK